MSNFIHHPASFKDPSGFVFQSNGDYYRQVNQSYALDYGLLMSSGLYKVLTDKELLVPHAEIGENISRSAGWYKTLLPEQLSFISYPYEWSFDQLKDAALLTLRIVKIALHRGMIIKDATPFNVQFRGGRPVFIDTLSFEKYDASKPWIAYRQFCESFLFPLYLEHYLKIDTQKLLSVYLDGIPATMTAKLLPFKTRFRLSAWLHVYLQVIVGTNRPSNSRRVVFSKEKMVRLIDYLAATIRKLQVKTTIRSVWNNYYDETILSKNYLLEKEKIFRVFIDDINQGRVLDLGCNDGYFSQIIAEKNLNVLAADFDSQCVNKLYLSLKDSPKKGILPLCIDISNPSPALGFRHAERQSFTERAKSDVVVALALIHHLVLGKNIPIPDVVKQFADLTKSYLIIEFVPLQDEKAQQLILNKTNYHTPYDPPAFEDYFNSCFEIEKKEIIPGTGRILYRMKRR